MVVHIRFMSLSLPKEMLHYHSISKYLSLLTKPQYQDQWLELNYQLLLQDSTLLETPDKPLQLPTHLMFLTLSLKLLVMRSKSQSVHAPKITDKSSLNSKLIPFLKNHFHTTVRIHSLLCWLLLQLLLLIVQHLKQSHLLKVLLVLQPIQWLLLLPILLTQLELDSE